MPERASIHKPTPNQSHTELIAICIYERHHSPLMAGPQRQRQPLCQFSRRVNVKASSSIVTAQSVALPTSVLEVLLGNCLKQMILVPFV